MDHVAKTCATRGAGQCYARSSEFDDGSNGGMHGGNDKRSPPLQRQARRAAPTLCRLNGVAPAATLHTGDVDCNMALRITEGMHDSNTMEKHADMMITHRVSIKKRGDQSKNLITRFCLPRKDAGTILFRLLSYDKHYM